MDGAAGGTGAGGGGKGQHPGRAGLEGGGAQGRPTVGPRGRALRWPRGKQRGGAQALGGPLGGPLREALGGLGRGGRRFRAPRQCHEVLPAAGFPTEVPHHEAGAHPQRPRRRPRGPRDVQHVPLRAAIQGPGLERADAPPSLGGRAGFGCRRGVDNDVRGRELGSAGGAPPQRPRGGGGRSIQPRRRGAGPGPQRGRQEAQAPPQQRGPRIRGPFRPQTLDSVRRGACGADCGRRTVAVLAWGRGQLPDQVRQRGLQPLLRRPEGVMHGGQRARHQQRGAGVGAAGA